MSGRRMSPRSRGRRNRSEKQKKLLVVLALLDNPKYTHVRMMGYDYGYYAGIRSIQRNADDAWLMYIQITPTGILDEYSKQVFKLAFDQGLDLGTKTHKCPEKTNSS